ncbi:MAG: hypothetical protein GY784_06810 [Gammaproteobacteria bacterium]|nr:hypothetical protein [Gammaproteobacteria bacterium]
MSVFEDSNKHTRQYQLITNKRLALEELISIASGVHNQQTALNELAIIARPSQQFSGKVAKYLKSITSHLQNDSVEEIIEKLDKVEAVTQKLLVKVLRLADLDVNALQDKQFDDIEIESFTLFIVDFKRRTHTSLVLRYVLHQRGVAVSAFKLPISQEEIREQVIQLRRKENQCIVRIKDGINTIIDDARLLVAQGTLTAEIRGELVRVQKAMQVNLAHLDRGGAVTDIPNVFEIVTLELEQPGDALDSTSASHADAQDLVNGNVKADRGEEKPIPESTVKRGEISFLKRLGIWLLSPWSTGWSATKIPPENEKVEK